MTKRSLLPRDPNFNMNSWKNRPRLADAPRLAFSLDEASRICGIGRTSIYRAIKEGGLVARKYGGRTLVTEGALRDWLSKLPLARPDKTGDLADV